MSEAGVPGAPRVLLVGDGDSVHLGRLSGGLLALGAEVHVAGFADGALPAGARFHPLTPATPGDARYVLAAPALRRVIRTVRPKVVSAHYLTSYGFLAALTGTRPLVQTAWGSDLLLRGRVPWRRGLGTIALRRATLATGDSTSLLDEIARIAPRVPRHRFVFGPPLATFAAPPPKEDIVLSPRNHEPLYRIDLVLAAWERARARLPGHRLVVAGGGSLTSSLRHRAPGDVEFTGVLPQARMLDLVARSRLVVSVPESDATSAALLEALAARCSVVATDLAANREWVPATHLVPVGAGPDALADRMLACAAAPLSLDPAWSLEEQVRRLADAISLTPTGGVRGS